MKRVESVLEYSLVLSVLHCFQNDRGHKTYGSDQRTVEYGDLSMKPS